MYFMHPLCCLVIKKRILFVIYVTVCLYKALSVEWNPELFSLWPYLIRSSVSSSETCHNKHPGFVWYQQKHPSKEKGLQPVDPIKTKPPQEAFSRCGKSQPCLMLLSFIRLQFIPDKPSKFSRILGPLVFFLSSCPFAMYFVVKSCFVGNTLSTIQAWVVFVGTRRDTYRVGRFYLFGALF